ncbi:MAG: hypothetical protein A3F35_03270 [Candidatus Woykebacteria bacterium RIFCSPHIGHO2_12_FULL_45_10]|uniref:Zinc finger DksA/TraR C4-type domain-containing protein n=1 Tax=Candidatus Woykebacteria bacterium RIFCSPHIGHO2_12_FULL_45_10 TaxID=1802603 RepID=A0A1G1WQV7_9BACT|nr:MAG: hypothetical protein A3F35_03270 [Candidatus Woykebacteria bacterium RIFCSPHIGHO2_12_FULL_45_10]
MQIEKQKKALETEKQNLITQLDYYKKEDPFLSERRGLSTSADDDISETEGHDRITATRGALKKDLALVEAALKRLEEGKYGVCSLCGNKIEEARLEVLPTATLCASDERKKR